MMDPLEDVIGVVASALQIDRSRVTAASSVETIPEWDSLGQLKVCLAIEEKFGVSFDMDRIATSTSVAILRDLVVSEQPS